MIWEESCKYEFGVVFVNSVKGVSGSSEPKIMKHT
jgi:hypothetical protein